MSIFRGSPSPMMNLSSTEEAESFHMEYHRLQHLREWVSEGNLYRHLFSDHGLSYWLQQKKKKIRSEFFSPEVFL